MCTCTAATYIFTAPTCTTNIITLEACALNAEFQHFIPNPDLIKFPYFADTIERGDKGRKQNRYEVKQSVTLCIDNSITTAALFTMFSNSCKGLCNQPYTRLLQHTRELITIQDQCNTPSVTLFISCVVPNLVRIQTLAPFLNKFKESLGISTTFSKKFKSLTSFILIQVINFDQLYMINII